MAQRELIHDLVERSRERVVQVRAGARLLHVLQQQQLHQKLNASTSLPLLPPAPPLALVAPKDRTVKAHHAAAMAAHEQKARRRRHALPRLAKGVELHEASTSFEHYQHFMANKVYREETMHLQNRRVALVPKTDLLKKLAAVCAAALKEMESEADALVEHESLREKLIRAMALLRGGRAFADAKSLAPPPPPAYGDIKNAHLAFLQFKRDGVSDANQKRIHPSAGLQDGNTSTKMPIHFGDQICFLSSSSDLPLAIGPDGRSRPAQDSSAGPHMTFTIVDFRNPARYDEVTATDDFWLRVDPTYLVSRKLDVRHLCFNSDDSDPGEGDDLTSLLSDSSYYLGCPGWLDDGESNEASAQADEPRLRGQKRFRIVAMKASTPSKAYYGDDAATREYAVETNEGIMRLARWRFVRYVPRRHEQQVGKAADVGLDGEQDVNNAMLNCSTVFLVLSDFALVYDKGLRRCVGVHVSSDERGSLHGEKIRRQQRSDLIATVVHLSACARWQVRILQRTGGINYLQELELAMAAVTGDLRKEDGARVEWLRRKQDKMDANDRRLHANERLVVNARHQYDLVAAQSNSKLEQIERQKGDQAEEYFKQRLHALETVESGHKPYEIMQQQLHRVLELPRL